MYAMEQSTSSTPFLFNNDADSIVTQLREMGVECRESPGLIFTKPPENTPWEKGKLLFSPELWGKSRSAREGEVMWILKDGEYLMVEGGHKVCFTPLSHSSKVLKVFDRSRCSSDFYLRKDGHSIVSISPNEIAIARKDGKVFFLLPGIHHLGCNEIFDKSIKLSAFMERIGSDVSYNKIGESGFGVLAVANKPKGSEEKVFVLWETLVTFANGTFKVLLPGYYAYENNNYPLQRIMFLRQRMVSYKKELNKSGVYFEYHFGINLPSKDDFKSLKIGQKDYAEHIRTLLDDNDPQSISSLIKKVGEILVEIIDIKSQKFD